MKQSDTGRWVLLVLFIGATGVLATPTDPYAGVNTNWDRFGSVYGRIVENYYADVDQKEIMQAAIEGMLGKLDSYSQFYDAEGLRQLRQDTTGKFAGLGITVAIKDQFPVVIAPIEGTPADRAGLVSGDLIVSIEGQDTQGMPLEEVVERLRGDPGTQVRIKVAHRAGVVETREIALTREIIKIKSVILVEEVVPGIGYISLRQTRFSEETAVEVEDALKELNSREVEGLVLDLRGNPGGLLSQATQVADLFLPKGAPIVSVKERYGRGLEVRHSQRKPVAGDLPLVVLIDGGSASASEIVAGAIQDNDRGIIVGTTSFGKGSVQTIFDLQDVEDSALKLTTALYYTPSGRSIHRDTFVESGAGWSRIHLGERSLPSGPILDIIFRAADRQQVEAGLRARFDLDSQEIDMLLSTALVDFLDLRGQIAPDSADALSKPGTYLTRKGRKVYGGGGITPDILVEEKSYPDYVKDLERRRLFFDFVVDYVGEDTARFHNRSQVELDQEMLVAFKSFLLQKEASANNIKPGIREFERLKLLIDEMGWDEGIQASIDSVAGLMSAVASRGIPPRLEPIIMRCLKRELVLRLHGRQAQLHMDLEQDLQLEKAIDVIQNRKCYTQMLEKGAS